MDNVMKVKLASNDGPDVILFNDTSIPLNSQFPDFLLPLDDMGYNGKVYFEENNTFDGKVYGLSEGGYVAGIVYNKKTFADAGITAPPTKLDELMGAFETLKSKGITPIALNFKTQWPLSYWNTNKIHEAGGDVQYREKWLETDTPFTTDSPFGKVNTLLRDIVAKGYAEKDLVNGDWEPSRTDVATGKTAMFYLGNFAVPIVAEFGAKPEDVGFIPFPVDNSGKGATSMNMDRAYGVNKNTKHPETAKAFIKFMLEDSGYNDIAGMIPTVKDLPSGIPQFAEFFDMEPTIYYTVSNSDALTTALNKGQIKDLAIMQEVILAKDDATVQAVYDKYNKIWASARK
jgi:ABC-type glycerol-3-phosphate transport system substrate-binding protein